MQSRKFPYILILIASSLLLLVKWTNNRDGTSMIIHSVHHHIRNNYQNALLLLSDYPNHTSTMNKDYQTPNVDDRKNLQFEHKGVTLSRSIDMVEDGLSLYINFRGGDCKTMDDYGGNDCHYSWGKSLAMDITLNTNGKPFSKEDQVIGKFLVDYFAEWSFKCQVCDEHLNKTRKNSRKIIKKISTDQDCVLKIPVLGTDITFPAPPCPLGSSETNISFEIPLGQKSPTHGIPTGIKGHVSVERKNGGAAVKTSVQTDVI